MKKCVLFASAPIDENERVEISDGTVVICADAGVKNAEKMKITPDLVVGDFDSIDKSQIGDVCSVSFPSRKDETDLMLAIRYGIEAGCDDFTIYGALGGKRLDHTVAAFSALSFLMDNGYDARLICGKTVARLFGVGEYKIEKFDGYLSLFPFGCDRASVILSGMSYNGDVLLMSSFPIGVSNEVLEDFASVTVLQSDTESRVLMICSPKDN